MVVGGLAGAAVATSSSGGDEPVTATDHYTPGMTLEEVGRASVGQPGEVAPPCPDADTVTKLRDADIQVGPCDPLLEAGQAQIVPDDNIEPPEPTGAAVCAVVNVRSEVGITGTLCGTGAKILRATALQQDQGWFVKATYVLDGDAQPVTDVVCEGGPSNPDGLRVDVTGAK